MTQAGSPSVWALRRLWALPWGMVPPVRAGPGVGAQRLCEADPFIFLLVFLGLFLLDAGGWAQDPSVGRALDHLVCPQGGPLGASMLSASSVP